MVKKVPPQVPSSPTQAAVRMALAAGMWLGAASVAQAAVCMVTPESVGTGTGESWDNAADLHAALGNSSCTELWLKQGTYKPVTDAQWNAAPDDSARELLRRKFFAVTQPLKLLGGFAGTEAVPIDRATVDASKTILSGDIGLPSDPPSFRLATPEEQLEPGFRPYVLTPARTLVVEGPDPVEIVDNSYQILVIGTDVDRNPTPGDFSTESMLIDGISIEQASGSEYLSDIGGNLAGAVTLSGKGSSLPLGMELNNTIIQKNYAVVAAGLNVVPSANTQNIDIKITGSKFHTNLSAFGGVGAGLSIVGAAQYPNDPSTPGDPATKTTVTVVKSEFENNFTYYVGSGIGIRGYLDLALHVSDSIFRGNAAAKQGISGIYSDCTYSTSCTGEIKNSLFESNIAFGGYPSGVMFLSSGKWDILGSTFQNNITNGMNAGHILNANTRRFPGAAVREFTFENSTFANNTGVADSIVNMTMSGADSITFNQNTFLNNTSTQSPIPTGTENIAPRSKILTFGANQEDPQDYPGTPRISITNNIIWDTELIDAPLVFRAEGDQLPVITIDHNVAQGNCKTAAMEKVGRSEYDPDLGEEVYIESNEPIPVASCTNLIEADPKLIPIANNAQSRGVAKAASLKAGIASGAATPTMLLGTGSSALDAAAPGGASTDQRGVARPQGAAPDLGAVEMKYMPLTVTIAGKGAVSSAGTAPQSGNVTACDTSGAANCTATYLESSAAPQVTLTATAAADQQFDSWSGACSAAGTNPSASVSITAATSCEARFVAQAVPGTTPDVTATSNPGGSVSPPTQPNGPGGNVVFTLTPDAGYQVDTTVTVGGTCPAGSWSGNTYTTGAPTGPCTVEFTFKKIDGTTIAAVPVMSPIGMGLLTLCLGVAARVVSRKKRRGGMQDKV